MSKTVSVSFSPVINPEVCTEVVDAFAKSELGIAKAVKQATVARGKAINKMLDCMWVACDKPKDVFLKGNAATNGARFQIKAVFDAIVEAGNLTKATAASYQTGFWIAFEDGTPWTPDTANKKSEAKKAAIVERLETVAAREVEAPTGLYDVIVIDPPWPMQKIERDVRPNQVDFDYPVMSEAELAALCIPADEHCHVWLWTTHKFMPMALRLLDVWGLKYVCTFVWHKPGGFQPIGLPQYNCEFAIYARKGTPQFLDTKAFSTAFSAPRGGHSEKPEEFYDVLRRVTGGRRLDMFNRRKIEGFTGWGKEAA
jgi:N6-adenosine-specific RNA methylase IME4